MAHSSKDEKEIFYSRFDELDELALESEGEVTIKPTPFKATPSCSSSIFPREHSSSKQEFSSSQSKLTSAPGTPGLVHPLTHPSTAAMPAQTLKRKPESGKAAPKLSKRQTSKKSFQLQPENAQIFRGLTFYFVPNNDIAAARKKRIAKAQEYGAVWARDWSATITHVIVDRSIRLSEVRKAIEPGQLKPSQVVVNETYPPDCIKYRVLLPVGSLRFQVPDDDLSPSGGAEGQHPLEKGESSHVATLLHSAVPGTTTRAQKQGDEQEEQDLMSHDSTSLSSAEGQGKRALPTKFGRQEVDELDEIVAEVQETTDLPLDSDDESIEQTSYTSSSSLDDYRQTKIRKKDPKASATGLVNAPGNFSCMRKNEGTGNTTNPNFRTIEKLDKMAQYYDRIGDHWRTAAYRKCITALRRQSEHITTRDQGDEGARLRRLESTVLDPNDQLLQLFMGIYQVGLPTASRWIAQGHKSLEDLKFRADLTTNQKIGIDHYNDFLTRIPRNEVMAHADIVKDACAKADPKLQVIVGGSYRRGAADSGDIDCIVTKEHASLENIRTLLIDTVIPQLFRDSFLKAGLATSSSTSRDHDSKWHGASALPGSQIWRRIDMLFVPWDEFGAALIYFTGNDIFNRSIRLLANRKKMRLNQHGLYGDVMRGDKRERITKGKLLEGRSEKRIFEILGVPWRPPEHRIC